MPSSLFIRPTRADVIGDTASASEATQSSGSRVFVDPEIGPYMRRASRLRGVASTYACPALFQLSNELATVADGRRTRRRRCDKVRVVVVCRARHRRQTHFPSISTASEHLPTASHSSNVLTTISQWYCRHARPPLPNTSRLKRRLFSATYTADSPMPARSL